MYTIDFDQASRIMRIGATGFWSLPTLAGFSTTLLARCVAVKLRHGDFATLVDVSELPVQSKDVALGIEMLLGHAMKITTAPLATAVASPLARLQAERVLRADHSRVFGSLDEAQAWLDDVWIRRQIAA